MGSLCGGVVSVIDTSKPQGVTGRAITYRLREVWIHPKTRRGKGFGLIDYDTAYIVGKPGDCARFEDQPSAIRYHAVVTGCADDFVRVVISSTAPMKSGRI